MGQGVMSPILEFWSSFPSGETHPGYPRGGYGQSYFLTYRSVFWEAEQGHVSISAAHSIVKEVRGKVGLG